MPVLAVYSTVVKNEINEVIEISEVGVYSKNLYFETSISWEEIRVSKCALTNTYTINVLSSVKRQWGYLYRSKYVINKNEVGIAINKHAPNDLKELFAKDLL